MNDDSDSDLDEIAVRSAREAMPSTSPLSLAPSMNGSKKPTYSRHASPSPVRRPSLCVTCSCQPSVTLETQMGQTELSANVYCRRPQASSPPLAPKAAPLPPTAPVAAIAPALAPAGAASADDASTKELVEMVAAMQTEIKALRDLLAEQPTVGQFEKLQQQLRMQNTEMGNMREKMDKMQQQINSMSGRSNGVSIMKNEAVVVSAEVLPLHRITGNKEPQVFFFPLCSAFVLCLELAIALFHSLLSFHPQTGECDKSLSAGS